MAIVLADIQGVAPNVLPGVTEFIARRVLAYARTIAPCIPDLIGEDRELAIAILQGVALEVRDRGSRMIASQAVGSARVTYRELATVFSPDDKAALRALCGATSQSRMPAGSFPTDRPTSRLWPEGA